jgi:hypothetical protein
MSIRTEHTALCRRGPGPCPWPRAPDCCPCTRHACHALPWLVGRWVVALRSTLRARYTSLPPFSCSLYQNLESTEMGHSIKGWTSWTDGSKGPRFNPPGQDRTALGSTAWTARLISWVQRSPPRSANWLKVQPEMCASSGSDQWVRPHARRRFRETGTTDRGRWRIPARTKYW